MIGVHHGIHGDEIGNLGIAVFLVNLKKFVGIAGFYHKQILCQQGFIFIGEIELVEIYKVG